MATASAETVKSLRERTGAGMMDCKAALEACGGDMEQAIDFLRKKGLSQAAKRAGREAKEGLVIAQVRGDKAVVVEANCETDFVARTDDFKNLAALAVEEVFSHGEGAVSSEKVSHRVAELTGKIGEKILVRRAKALQSKDGGFFAYIHSNSRLGVIVEIAASKTESKKNALLDELGKNLAMQVAAGNPLCIGRAEVPAAVIEREREIFKEEVKGKPANIVEKIIEGKLDKFYKANCLLEQPFIRDDKLTVQQLVDQTAKKLGDSLQVKQFVRFQLGEALPG
jgi:elongation factor Ts